jgi:hypothetical protein
VASARLSCCRFRCLDASAAAIAAPAASYPATLLSVGDGDTLRVQAGGRAITIRLACIDAPETAQSPWGQQSRGQHPAPHHRPLWAHGGGGRHHQALGFPARSHCSGDPRWQLSTQQKAPSRSRGQGFSCAGLSPGKASGHQPSTFTVTVLTLLALGAVTVSRPSR